MDVDDPRTLPWRPACPWAAPIPLREADFEPLHERDREWCLRSDLGSLRPFGVAGHDDGELVVGFADFQLPARNAVALRLGSGRAVFHRGRYIKGVGRTLLAANWADASDVLHSSGHMYPSGAIREYLVSRYLEARGLGHVIVPCEGLALRPLPEEFGAPLRAHATRMNVELAPIDTCMQALTFKPATFARWSNFVWLATHATGELDEVIRMGLALQHFGDPGVPLDVDACTPANIAASLGRAVERTRSSFCSFFEAGVFWGSFTNNATLDGRFLDLELPTFLCAPLVVALAPYLASRGLAPTTSPIYRWFGSELIDTARDLACTLTCMTTRLRELGERCMHASAGAFCVALADAIAETFGPDHWVRDPLQWRADLVRLYADRRGCPTDLDVLVDAVLTDAPVTMALERVELGLAAPEPAIRVATFMRAGSDVADDDGARRLLNGLLVELEQCRAVDELLRGLARAELEIRTKVRTRAEEAAA